VDATVREFKLTEFNRDYSDWPRRFSKWIEDQKLRAETNSYKSTPSRRDRPNQPNCGMTGLEMFDEPKVNQ
jgi:hypothetical protein